MDDSLPVPPMQVPRHCRSTICTLLIHNVLNFKHRFVWGARAGNASLQNNEVLLLFIRSDDPFNFETFSLMDRAKVHRKYAQQSYLPIFFT